MEVGITDPRYWQAVVIAEEMWEWLADNPRKEKRDWPKYLRYNMNMKEHECSLCEFMWHETYLRCHNCFLTNACRRYYESWCFRDEDLAQEAAIKIWEAIFKERLRIMEFHGEQL